MIIFMKWEQSSGFSGLYTMKSFVSGYAHVPWSVWFIFLEMKRVEAFEYKEILWRFPIMCKISPGSDSVSFSWQSPEPSNIDHDLNTDFFNCHIPSEIPSQRSNVRNHNSSRPPYFVLSRMTWSGNWPMLDQQNRPPTTRNLSPFINRQNYQCLPTIDMNQKYLFLS